MIVNQINEQDTTDRIIPDRLARSNRIDKMIRDSGNVLLWYCYSVDEVNSMALVIEDNAGNKNVYSGGDHWSLLGVV